ncbi:MAG TPA: type 1 glutamine amidotransferase [Pirellulales bacterium]
MRIHYFQHVAFEGLGCIESWAKEHGHALTATHFYAGQTPPASVDEIDWLIVMGGPMNIYEHDQYPWLAPEKTFIRQAIDAQKRVLGICLGAQLVADLLGSKVVRNAQKEIGWFPIETTSAARDSKLFAEWPAAFPVFHWHGETFGLPPGATHIARSVACEQQAFLYGDRVVGLQFHLESTPESVQPIIENLGDELVSAPYIQTAEAMLANAEGFRSVNRAMVALLDRLAALK